MVHDMTSHLINVTEETCNFIRKRIPNKWGLFRTESFDVEKNIWTSEVCDPDDFGDFAPFMAWHDVVTGHDENLKWISRQFDLLNSVLKQKSGLYYPFSAGERRVSQSNIFPIYPQNHVDFILGCNLLYMLLHEGKYLDGAITACDAIAKHAISRKGFVYGAVIPALNMYYPKFGYLRHKAAVSGIFIEEFSNLYSLTKNAFYLENAKRMADAWTGTETFQRYGICCDQVSPLLNRQASQACTLGKMNTNLSNGLIRLCEVSGDKGLEEIVEKNMRGLTLFKNEDNSYSAQVNAKSGKIHDTEVQQVQNHMIMGTFLDAFEVLGKHEYLEMAEDCMDFWLGQQQKTGFFPMKLSKTGNWNVCDMDTHSDITVIMCRLYLITKKPKYRNAVKRSVESFRFFVEKGKIYKEADLLTGKRVSNAGELKYLGGFLKGLVSSCTILKDIKKVDRNLLRLLMRDR